MENVTGSSLRFKARLVLTGLAILAGCSSSAQERDEPVGPDAVIHLAAPDFKGAGRGSWELVEGVEGSTSPAVLRALKGDDLTSISEPITYMVDFPEPGRYYVWVRGSAPSADDARVYVGLGGEWESRNELRLPVAEVWTVTDGRGGGERAMVRVEGAGRHELSVWRKDDGFILDEVVLAGDPRFVPPPTDAALLWQTRHESGDLEDWYRSGDGTFCGGDVSSLDAEARVTEQVARSGAYSLKLRIEGVDGDQASRMFRGRCESEESRGLYYSAWLYFPHVYATVDGWWNVWQWKSQRQDALESDVQWVLDVSGNGRHMYFRMRDKLYADSNWHDQQDPLAIPVERWVHVEAFYLSDEESGTVVVWQDGVEIFRFEEVPTIQEGGDTRWSVNNYTSRIEPDPAVIFVDDVSIATQRLGAAYPPLEEDNP